MSEFPQNVFACADRNSLPEALEYIESHLANQPDDAQAQYLAAVVLNLSGQRELALGRLEKVALRPGIDTDFDRLSLADFERWQSAAADFAAGQRAALARAWPVTPICSLPRSGSGWFVAMFARLFDLPVGRMCFGRFPDLRAMPGWVACIAEGGATSHDHLPANEENLRVLRSSGIEKVIVQVRDPRQAMVSLYHHQNLESDQQSRGLLPHLASGHAAARPIAEAADETIAALLGQLVGWLEDWLRVADGAAPPAVHFIAYEALKAAPRQIFTEVFDFFAPPEEYRGLLDFVEDLAALKTPSFRSGETDEWRRVLSPGQLALSEDLLPATLLQRFAWQ